MSMLSGRDCFSTTVVALRHRTEVPSDVLSLPRILAGKGYNTTAVGCGGNVGMRGFDSYLEYPGWGSWAEGRSPKAENLNEVAVPELERLAADGKPFFLFLRHMDPHAPYLPPAPFERLFYSGDELDPGNSSMEPVWGLQAVSRLLRRVDAPRADRRRVRRRPRYGRRPRLHGRLHPAPPDAARRCWDCGRTPW